MPNFLLRPPPSVLPQPGTAAALTAVCKEYHDRIFVLEGDKWDAERSCKIKMLEVKKKKKEGHMSREGTALSCVVASSNNEDGTSLEATFPV